MKLFKIVWPNPFRNRENNQSYTRFMDLYGATSARNLSGWISVLSSECGKNRAPREDCYASGTFLSLIVFSSEAIALLLNKIETLFLHCHLEYSFDVAFTVDVYSVADQAWQLLKLYLDRLGPRDGHVYYRCVASKLLSAGAALPTWLVNDYKVRRHMLTNSSRKLLILFVVMFKQLFLFLGRRHCFCCLFYCYLKGYRAIYVKPYESF